MATVMILTGVVAPCKINLHLRVLPRREDGFHGIESLFQSISLADSMDVRTGKDSGLPAGSCRVTSPLLELPARNTLTKAIDEFRALTGIDEGIAVAIDKVVPAGAGLGGGSSDAARLLMALCGMYGANVPKARLSEAAARIGSDVPFFLDGGAALVRGRGEIVEPIEARADVFGVVAVPDVHCATAEAYARFDRWAESGKDAGFDWPALADLEGIYRGPLAGWSAFRNGFQDPIETAFPAIREVRLGMQGLGALFTTMSGSGSAVVGFFPDAEIAKEACRIFAGRCRLCREFLLLAS